MSRLKSAVGKSFQNQNRAVANLFRAPNKIEDVAATLTKLERGDLKLRVRALEAERALTRVQVGSWCVCVYVHTGGLRACR